MNCPKCGARMQRVGLGQLVGENVFVTLECTGCHHRLQVKPGELEPPAP